MKDENFIDEYCKIIDQCHGQLPETLWFSTWMSSKSPYFDFPRNFEIFWLTGFLPKKLQLNKKIFLAYRLLVTALSLTAKSLYLKISLRKELKNLSSCRGKEINLVRTFIYSKNPKASDPFWGELIDHLGRNNIPLLTVYDPNFAVFFCKNAYDPIKNNIPYLIFLSPLALLKNYFLILNEAFRKIEIEGDFFVKNINLQKFVINSYQEELLKPASLVHLVYKDCFQKIFSDFKVHNAYLTFENNPWEKMFYIAMKSKYFDIATIGFQHSSIQEGATNYRLSSYENSHGLRPEKILSVGEYTTDLMKKSPHYQNIIIETGCALRYKYLENIQNKITDTKKETVHLLVVLDGTPDTIKLVELIEEFINSGLKKNISIRIKDHPNLQVKDFYPEFINKKIVKKNIVTITNENLEKNLDWADILIYTGSTCSIEALMMGKGIINYNFSLFNYDPLFQFSDFKWIVSNAKELSQVLDNYSQLTQDDLMQRREKAKKFVKRYFSTCTKENIERFL